MAAKLILAALAVFATASPLSSSSNAPCLSDEFSLQMAIGQGDTRQYLTLTAIDSGTLGTVNIVGEKLARYSGTPAYQSDSSPSATLGFDIKTGEGCETTQTGKFNIWVPDLGESYGRSDPVTATKNATYPHFSVSKDGSITPQLTAASQWWYACNITVQGKSYWGLSWGVYNSNGSAPYGCQSSDLRQNFNIPCNV